MKLTNEEGLREKEEKQRKENVLTYLNRISIAVASLAIKKDWNSMEGTEGMESGDFYVNKISQNLFEMCNPCIFGLKVPLSVVESLDSKEKQIEVGMEVDDDDDDDEEGKKSLPSGTGKARRLRTRLDVLRSILRAMAPIAMDVGARVASIALASLSDGRSEAAVSGFILFAAWLPIAPQLTPIVSSLFGMKSFACPLEYCSIEAETGDVSQAEKQFIVAEAANSICQFYAERGDHKTMTQWWSWGHLFGMLYGIDVSDEDAVMEDSDNDDDAATAVAGWTERSFVVGDATKWHAARAIGYLINFRPAAFGKYLLRLSVQDEMVPWVLHPWILEEEEEEAQLRQLRGMTALWNDSEEFCLPAPEEVRLVVPVYQSLVHVGKGVLLVKRNPIIESVHTTRSLLDNSEQSSTNGTDLVLNSQRIRKNLIMTETTARNLSLLGTSLCTDPYPPPILLCGPNGSGKSSLVRELAHYCASSSERRISHSKTSHTHQDELLELHVDEETDSKTLIGSYTTTDVPGEFVWRPGALTRAVRMGKWVLMEDIDSVPLEIQAAIVKLLEDRLLPLGSGKIERCHPNFRLFGTCTTAVVTHSEGDTRSHGRLRAAVSSAGSGGKRILHPNLWRKVHVDPLPFSELVQVSRALYASLPEAVLNATLEIFRALDSSGREDSAVSNLCEPEVDSNDAISDSIDEKVPIQALRQSNGIKRLMGGRHASVRDLMKLLSRISATLNFERNVTYTTEAQRTFCLAESVDIFVAACPSLEYRRDFIRCIAAPIWDITADLALRYVETRRPSITLGVSCTEVGRARVVNATTNRKSDSGTNAQKFAQTNYALRLMESAGICISQNEPILLVGETGVGKTTVIQQLAGFAAQDLVVQNLSLQTDSTDLLGGYRPLEMRHVARRVYLEFVDLFVATFSRKQNIQFLNYASSTHKKGQWKRLSQCFRKAAKLGLAKVHERESGKESDEGQAHDISMLDSWTSFQAAAERYERQRLACETGLAFAFTEGALVDAIRHGKWILLDEINLASSETLQRLCGLLDDSHGSVTLTERGDSEALKRHPDFRLFAAMNPATDAGKKDLPASIRSRFTELYVDELVDPVELRIVSARYLTGVIAASEKLPEHTETVISAVEVYLQCRDLAEEVLVDAGGQKPRYTMRTLCRALTAARNLIVQQRFSLNRSLLEGFELAFEGPLDGTSTKVVRKVLRASLGKELTKGDLDHPPRRPGSKSESDKFVLIKPFWIKAGPLEQEDWAETARTGRSKFILIPSASSHLRRIARAVAAGPWPVLLEGPTSAGKTTLVEYLAARCGHPCVRINNHEHTDVQEYTGTYAADSSGSISFHDGILVRALRLGHWVILDELNLAPSEVLEALNRLLDDNRELYLPEINETIKPHADFRLFATQNPSGAYGGRKPLSKAFRNRFVEIHMPDIPTEEMTTILELRCMCPPSHAKALVKVMNALRQRRSKSGVFLGKDGLITPRDLFRWAERRVVSKLDLAHEGYILLAERLRTNEEKEIVREEIEGQLKVTLDCESLYYGKSSDARLMLESAMHDIDNFPEEARQLIRSIAPTKSLLRLLSLVMRCIKQQEPVLLVGDTGCGKTTVVQLLSVIMPRLLHIINCHATTETGDVLGGLRPVRGRNTIANEMLKKVQEILLIWPYEFDLDESLLPIYLKQILITTDSDSSPASTILNVDLPENAVSALMSFTRTLLESRTKENINETCSDSDESSKKRRKLTSGNHLPLETGTKIEILSEQKEIKINQLANEIETLFRRHSSLFEWADGPLVTSMKEGHMLLLDEMSLAEDAVLERLNSVLEPSRTLVLAEKGDDGTNPTSMDSHIIRANDNFRIFATMNPGGDFGKRELSPALRSRFTEIWVPAVTEPSDISLVLERTLASKAMQDAAKTYNAESMIVVRQKMLEYVGWFNNSVCGDASSTCTDMALSLRDILAWARFIVDVTRANTSTNLWDIYCHGACLMHLDGLGLGTGLSREDADTTKQLAQAYLVDQVPVEFHSSSLTCLQNGNDSASRHYVITDSTFGVNPFTVPRGSEPIPNSNFNLKAPTTGTNLLRVLRAMQLSKPVLLEGSPGVGKTSLISALAAASGHKLVRINLSEQTDIADLMGSDLPIPDAGSTDNGDNPDSTPDEQTVGSSFASSFKWCDGVLLKAIKQGDWVLLDELNLASQTVLEGLNSCLDHRANVFIPELGKTFQCPATFRVFGAQNPLAQGGGRKGLPKSFLNRFTKVYVEPLTEEDLGAIVTSRFPLIPESFVNSMIDFNNIVHRDVVERRAFGEMGSPWEFNLRDVFRWCELIMFTGSSDNLELSGRFAGDLYLQRFRSLEDREMLKKCYKQCFGNEMIVSSTRLFRITDTSICIGTAILQRKHVSTTEVENTYGGTEPEILRSLFFPMESVARCIQMNWPCLLVGPSSSGKTTLLKGLAELCNARLVEVSLTASSDVNELVGCFEQVDSLQDEKEIRQSMLVLYRAACEYLVQDFHQLKILHQISKTYSSFTSPLEGLVDPESSGFSKKGTGAVVVAKEFSKLLSEGAAASQDFMRLYGSRISWINRKLDLFEVTQSSTKRQKSKNHFRWVDGILIAAMENGDWLHLENVNFCPSSVLDRLNPLMEKDGELLLTECSIDEDSATSGHRVVKPHPDFKIFLSMNPSSGEVSRAMRNRCVEISLLPLNPDELAQTEEELLAVSSTKLLASSTVVDSLDIISKTGIRSSLLATRMLKFHYWECLEARKNALEPPSPRSLQSWGRLMSSLMRRGFSPVQASSITLQLSYELDIPTTQKMALMLSPSHADFKRSCSLMSSPTLRSGWAFNPRSAHLKFDARLLKLVVERNNGSKVNHDVLLPDSLCELRTPHVTSTDFSDRYEKICSKLPEDSEWFSTLRKNLIALYVSKLSISDSMERFALLNGYDDIFSNLLKCTASLFQRVVKKVPRSISPTLGYETDKSTDDTPLNLGLIYVPSINATSDNKIVSVRKYYIESYFNRLVQQVNEGLTYQKLVATDSASITTMDLSVIEASICLHEERKDRSSVSCPITPILYPLFQAVDSWITILEDVFEDSVEVTQDFIRSLTKFLSHRDRLWNYLEESRLTSQDSYSFLSFDETGFVVHWLWFKKKLKELMDEYNNFCFSLEEMEVSALQIRIRKMEVLVYSVDRVLFDNVGDSASSSLKVWKKGGHPLVPAAARHWEAIHHLRICSKSCTFLSESRFGLAAMTGDSNEAVELADLVASNHPVLFVKPEEKMELLAALCMAHWSTTDELRAEARLNTLPYDCTESHIVLSTKIAKRAVAFAAQMNAIKIDSNINTVENAIDIEKLEKLKSDSLEIANIRGEDDVIECLLLRFSFIQASQFAEFWCVQEEANIIGELSKIMISPRCPNPLLENTRSMLPWIKNYIDVAVDKTCWSMADIRPYQTLLWACDGPSLNVDSLSFLLRCLIPQMMFTAAQHAWCNSFNDLQAISERLVCPPLWCSDSEIISQERAIESTSKAAFSAGPTRLKQPVRSMALFRLIRSEFLDISDGYKDSPYASLENYRARIWQSQNLIDQFSSLPIRRSTDVARAEIQYLVVNSIESLLDYFDEQSATEILSIVKSPTMLQTVDEEIVQHLVQKCNHPAFIEICEVVLLPLLSSLRHIYTAAYNSDKFAEEMALAWIYIGLLRIQLFIPGSPLDPGKKPIAKVEQHDRHLDSLRGKLAAARLDSGFLTGNFFPNSEYTQRLLAEAESTEVKRSKQEKKRVERISEAPPFFDLFRESRNFLRNVADTDGVLSLAQVIRNARIHPETASKTRGRELNWQNSAGSFCARLSSHFAPYEDVTVPFTNAIRNLQRGLRELADTCLNHSDSYALQSIELMNDFLTYPLGNLALKSKTNGLERTTLIAAESCVGDSIDPRDEKRCQFTITLATLCRLDIQKKTRLGKMSRSSHSSCIALFRAVAKDWLGSSDNVTDLYESEDEIQERMYRDQFPDHSKEFNDIIYKVENTDDIGFEDHIEERSMNEVLDMKLSENQLSLLSDLHRDLFSTERTGTSDFCRTRAFRVAYSAACQIGQSPQWQTSTSVASDRSGAHIMALSLITSWSTGISLEHSTRSLNLSDALDFHKDANPAEVVMASIPLRQLIARISQLLTAFPGHSILAALGQVAERVRKLDLNSTSVGKVMTGLEVILRKAQEWEQHASDRVKLGPPLAEISRLVARWRKLELQSWSTLLNIREKRHIQKARKHWARLNTLLSEFHSTMPPSTALAMYPCLSSVNTESRISGDCPTWVWKRCSQEMQRVASSTLNDADMEKLAEIARVLDGFMLTSVLGEFKERLSLIKTFASQLQWECTYAAGYDVQRLSVARILSSLCLHYGQFVEAVSSKKGELRLPIEKRLKDEVKLAKWDEQSYYALAESSEKNHRKLMKILREYDEVLDMGIGKFLEEQICYGIRAPKDSIDGNFEPCTSIPPNSMIFLIRDSNESFKPVITALNNPTLTGSTLKMRKWTDLDALNLQCDSYVHRMSHYCNRIRSIRVKDRINHWAHIGAEGASDLCESVFMRIESLRGEKTTKPMKQRALIDLTKELKRNGYASTKWAVPTQIREMVHLLMLPGSLKQREMLSVENSMTLDRAELYFQKSVTELNRFRSEIVTFGSQHMSPREMHIMQSFSEHGLLMLCQQRCSIANILSDGSDLQQMLKSSAFLNKNLPIGQVSLQVLAEKFDDAFLSVLENLRQLLLLMRTAVPLIENGKKSQVVHDSVSVIDSCVSGLQLGYSPFESTEILSNESLLRIVNTHTILQDAKQQVIDCKLECMHLGCLPEDVFDVCLAEIDRACVSASTCEEQNRFTKQIITDRTEVSNIMVALSSAVKSILLSVQGMSKPNTDQTGDPESILNVNDASELSEREQPGLWKCHMYASKEWGAINVKKLNSGLQNVFEKLRLLHESSDVPETDRNCCVNLTSDLCILMEEVGDLIKQKLAEYVLLFRSTTKLTYVLLRVFRVLVAKGFCADNVTDGAEGGEEGDISGMNFDDDNDGTGMGEGDGKKDVTDQLESEEQLLGLKGDEDDEKGESAQEQKELNEEEAEQGMEMEGDFDGELCDVPEPDNKDNDDDNDENDDEEELDRDMGDGMDPNEEIVDEKMWDDSDDENELNPGEEKFEKDSGMKGEALEDELRTKEDDEENGNAKDDQDAEPTKQGEPEITKEAEAEAEAEPPKEDGEADMEMEGEINEDAEDNYEEKPAGVDVRNDEQDEDDGNAGDEGEMDLGDDLNLDDMSEGGDENGDMDIDDEVPNEEGPEEPGVDVADDTSEMDASDNEADDNDVVQTGAQHGGDPDPQDENEDTAEEPYVEENPNMDVSGQESAAQEAHGVTGKDGNDRVKEQNAEDDEDEEETGRGEDDADGEGDDAPENPSGNGGGEAGEGDRDASTEGQDGDGAMQTSLNAPNPFRDPGDATDFWHKKLNMVDDKADATETQESNESKDEDQKDSNGEFEFTTSNQESTTQVLGGTTEEEAVKLECKEEDMDESTKKEEDVSNSKEEKQEKEGENSKERASSKPSQKTSGPDKKDDMSEDDEIDLEEPPEENEANDREESSASDTEEQNIDREKPSNKVVADLSQLRVRDGDMDLEENIRSSNLIEEEQIMRISIAEAAVARARWSEIQSETYNLSRRLCEKLRLVMEPLVATKLRGDYRTGKRINMKRVIGYIASGYRKDKIWLKRTKPAKRNYRVLLAVDDSESMQKSGAGDMALAALATLAVGMSQLEIGELGVASFGEEMRLLHPFQQPFTSESGVNLVQNFKFDEKRTRTALCVESAITALESQGDSACMQLVFMISDGRIERDSRAALRRLIREMSERNILLVMIIVEGKIGGKTNKKESIINMKEVSFERGKPKVKQFIEDYPFPYYIVLEDMKSLPEILGDALRQWFEMLAQLNNNGM